MPASRLVLELADKKAARFPETRNGRLFHFAAKGRGGPRIKKNAALPSRCLLPGDAAKGEAVADGAAAAGIDDEEAARGAPGSVQAGDDLAVEVDYLGLGVDLKAAKGVEAARGLGTIDRISSPDSKGHPASPTGTNSSKTGLGRRLFSSSGTKGSPTARNPLPPR